MKRAKQHEACTGTQTPEMASLLCYICYLRAALKWCVFLIQLYMCNIELCIRPVCKNKMQKREENEKSMKICSPKKENYILQICTLGKLV